LLVVDKGTQTILALWENAAGASQTATLATTPELNLNHAVKWHDEYLYASSSTTGTMLISQELLAQCANSGADTVYRWPYSENEFRKPLQKRQDVITNMPPVGAHETRTLEFDAKGRLYIKYAQENDVVTK
jgi:glucose/arabinose dehydrogenase